MSSRIYIINKVHIFDNICITSKVSKNSSYIIFFNFNKKKHHIDKHIKLKKYFNICNN